MRAVSSDGKKSSTSSQVQAAKSCSESFRKTRTSGCSLDWLSRRLLARRGLQIAFLPSGNRWSTEFGSASTKIIRAISIGTKPEECSALCSQVNRQTSLTGSLHWWMLTAAEESQRLRWASSCKSIVRELFLYFLFNFKLCTINSWLVLLCYLLLKLYLVSISIASLKCTFIL